MTQEVEISSFDLRYQNHRMKSASAEKKLLASILEQARLIDQLHKIHKMSVSEMALLLEKSQGCEWHKYADWND